GEARQFGGIKKAERGIGRRHQPATVLQLDADIARRAWRQPALEQRAAEAANVLTQPCFVHTNIPFFALSHALAARPSRDRQEPKLGTKKIRKRPWPKSQHLKSP